jgi:hypothetical protein
MSESSILRRIFGSTGKDVTAEFRKLRNYKLHRFYFSQNSKETNKKDEMGGACSTNRREEECI